MDRPNVLYSDIDPFVQKWLADLIDRRLIPEGGIVGDIHDVVEPPETFHAFAGIGGWPLALKLAGFTGPVWTASLPCQPFSIAGLQKGTEDERHLWPIYKTLVEEHRPPIIFGEQVATPAGRSWLDSLSLELEAMGYAVGSADLCAAGVGAPHIRQRLFWVAYTCDARLEGYPEFLGCLHKPGRHATFESGRGPSSSTFDGMGDADSRAGRRDAGAGIEAQRESPFEGVDAWRVSDDAFAPDATGGFWRSPDWLLCRDPSDVPKLRPVERGTFPLADGVPDRVGLLRGYGNAIVPQLAAEFIRAALEAIHIQEMR